MTPMEEMLQRLGRQAFDAGRNTAREGKREVESARRIVAEQLAEQLRGYVAEATTARDGRQRAAHAWCQSAFGKVTAYLPHERAMRLLEEAMELAQAFGVQPAEVDRLRALVWSRPPGHPSQEIGGLGITLLCVAHALGLSADGEEARELDRVLALPLEHFARRHAEKQAAGVSIVPGRDGD